MSADPICCRNICVPDASSLLFSAQIELEGRTIFEWILDEFEVYINTQVKYECFQNLQKRKVVLPYFGNKFKREISKREKKTRDFEYEKCLTYLERYCNENQASNFLKLGPGEKHCVALSLFINAKYDKPVTFLTDDFESIKIISPILNEYKFAIQKSIPDFLINLLKTNRVSNDNHIRGALQTYYNIMKKAVVHNKFKKRMRFNCHSYWIKNCGLRCA